MRMSLHHLSLTSTHSNRLDLRCSAFATSVPNADVEEGSLAYECDLEDTCEPGQGEAFFNWTLYERGYCHLAP